MKTLKILSVFSFIFLLILICILESFEIRDKLPYITHVSTSFTMKSKCHGVPDRLAFQGMPLIVVGCGDSFGEIMVKGRGGAFPLPGIYTTLSYHSFYLCP